MSIKEENVEENIEVNHGGKNSLIEMPQPKKIKVDYSAVHHRGVFATEDIESEELIERCPLVILDFRVKYHKDRTLFDYLYTHKCPCKECENHGSLFLMVMGYGMIYNHQDIPNTTWSFQTQDKIADVTAVKPIKKGEEIFVSYGDSYFNGKEKITIGNNKLIEDLLKLPEEWSKWVVENIKRGVPNEKIKEILISNNFDVSGIEFGEN